MTSLLTEGMLDTGDVHLLRYAEYGNPDAPATIVLHGGPGSGCQPSMLTWFDLARQRVVMFDQRGAGGSTPAGRLEGNTTHHLVQDIERLRGHLGIGTWMVVGGSWGATLGLAYAGAHPQSVQALVLRGLFLPTAAGLDWFFNGLQPLVPAGWAAMTNGMTAEQRQSILPTLSGWLLSDDEGRQRDGALRWARYEDAVVAAMTGAAVQPAELSERLVAKYRIQAHYLSHRGFVTERGMFHAARRAKVPTLCLHGTHDWICPPANALRLQRLLPHAELRWVTRGTHLASDPLVQAALRDVVSDAFNRFQAGRAA